MNPQRAPEKIVLHKASATLELVFGGQPYTLSAEFLRVHSPSAEVRGHGNAVLQHGKKHVAISDLKAAGNYALQIEFDDGHKTGLYGWDYLRELCQQREKLWQDYLEKLHQAGLSREPDAQVVRLISPKS